MLLPLKSISKLIYLRESLLSSGNLYFNQSFDLSHAASTFPEQYRLPGYAFKISFVIPTRDKLSLLSECIDSILANPPDGDYEILILDNQSVENETLRGLAGYGLLESVTIVECDYDR